MGRLHWVAFSITMQCYSHRLCKRLFTSAPFQKENGSNLKSVIDELEQCHTRADSAAFAALIRRCGNSRALSEGKRLHGCITRYGYIQDIYLQNLLVQMYGKCGSVEDAQAVFESIRQPNTFSWNIMIAAYAQNGHLQEAIDAFNGMPNRDGVSWNTMIAAYVQNGDSKEALKMFRLMDSDGFSPDNVTLITVIDVCATTEDLAEGRFIHGICMDSELHSDLVVGAALVNMYGKCGSIVEAKSVFDEAPTRNVVVWTSMVAAYAQNGHLQHAWSTFKRMPQRNVVTWNAMITGYARNGQPSKALDLSVEMELEGVRRDRVTFVSIIDACAVLAALQEGESIHAQVCNSGLHTDTAVRTALVNMYSKCQSLEAAKHVFDLAPHEDVSLRTAMVAAYARAGQLEDASRMLEQMMAELEVVSFNILITAYAQSGHLWEAQSLFDNMRKRDVVSWNSMIAAYAENGHSKDALGVFKRMDLEGLQPTSITFVHVLDACSRLESLAEGKLLHAQILASKSFISDVLVQTALVNMFGKCGSLQEARRIFDTMHRRNMISWNSMLTAYAQNGHSREALEIFRVMDLEGVEPSKVTFISILDACADIGALQEGKAILSSLDIKACELEGVLGTAVVNMYSKCGMLRNARAMFDRILARDVVCWSAMIAAYTQNGHSTEALELFQLLSIEGVEPSETIFVLVLSACSHAGLSSEGQKHFVSMKESYGIQPTADHYVCMIDLLGRAGRLNEAEELLNDMPFQPRMVEWTTLLGACRTHGDLRRGARAAEFASKFDPENAGHYVLLSNIFSSSGTADGQEDGGEPALDDIECEVKSSQVNMWCKEFPKKAAKWDSVRRIDGHSAARLKEQLERALDQLDQSAGPVSSSTYFSLLQQCCMAKALPEGKRLHGHIARSGHEGDGYMGNRLIQMYGSCGSLEEARLVFENIQEKRVGSWNLLVAAHSENGDLQEARKLFDDMPNRDVVSWNCLITAYTKHEREEGALKLFRMMHLEGVQPDRLTFLAVLDACGSLAEGNTIHALIAESELESDLLVGTSLVNMYGRCGSHEDARIVFDCIHRDLVLWTAMIRAYAQNGHLLYARGMFERMPQHNVVSWNVIITAYAQAGYLQDARSFLEKLPMPDTVSWTVLITAYAQTGYSKEAIELFCMMDLEGEQPSSVTFLAVLDAIGAVASLEKGKIVHAKIINNRLETNIKVLTTLINMYGKCGGMEDAKSLFERIPQRNVATWNALIGAYAQNGHGRQALELFKRMDLEGLQATKITFVGILEACTGLAEGEFVHSIILDKGLQMETLTGTALVNMYGKYGNIDKARMVFDKMPHSDVISWTAMVAAYAKNGHEKDAVKVFQWMESEGMKPNVVTFISLLSACSHGGFLDDGRHYFVSMTRDYSIAPVLDHYICMIDLLGRVGQLEDAEDLIKNMPFEPGIVAWTTVLGACMTQVAANRGSGAAERIVQLNPGNPSPYVLLSNIYVEGGNPEDASRVRKSMEVAQVQSKALLELHPELRKRRNGCPCK